MRSIARAALALASTVVLCSLTLSAAPPTREGIGRNAFRELVGAPFGERIAVPDVVLGGSAVDLTLEEFDVYAPEAKVQEYSGIAGEYRDVERSKLRFFRGSVNGEADSIVFLAVGESVGGFIFSQDREYTVRSSRRPAVRRDVADTAFETVVEEVHFRDELSDGEKAWRCVLDQYSLDVNVPRDAVTKSLSVQPNALPPGSTTANWVLNLAVLADVEFFTRNGGNLTTAQNYLANLVAASSVIYHRDLQTDLKIAYSAISTSEPDPFSFADPVDALYELGKYWHNTPALAAIARSAVMLVSGKDVGAGVAWRNPICTTVAQDSPVNDNPTVPNAWAGAYGVFMDAALPGGTNFNPDGNPNYQAATTTLDISYWPVLAFAHELGHIVGSKHTHCIALSAPEIALFGRNFVDQCYSGEGTGCYSNGSTGAVDANLPAELGTVMSYCHLTGGPNGFGRATRFTFGKTGEASHNVVDQMKSQIGAATPNLTSGISAPASVAQNAGASASIVLPAGVSYQWTITNGTITGGASGTTAGAGTVTVNFTGLTNPVTLKVDAWLPATRCGVSDVASIAVTTLTAAVKGDLNSDGKADLIWRNSVSGANSFWFLSNTSVVGGGSLNAVPDVNWKLAGTGDFNADGKTDLVWHHDPTGANSVWFMNGVAYSSQTALASAGGTEWRIAGVGDFDANGTTDLVWRNIITGANSMWFLNGTAVVTGGATLPVTDLSWQLVGAGDVNADGRADLVWWNSTVGSVSVWFMNGTTRTSSWFVGQVANMIWRVAAVGDYNGDGHADIMWKNTAGGTAIWFLNGSAVLGGGFVGAVADTTWDVVGPR